MTCIELKDGSKYKSLTNVFDIDKQISGILNLFTNVSDITNILFIYVNGDSVTPDKPLRIKISEIKTYYTI